MLKTSTLTSAAARYRASETGAPTRSAGENSSSAEQSRRADQAAFLAPGQIYRSVLGFFWYTDLHFLPGRVLVDRGGIYASKRVMYQTSAPASCAASSVEGRSNAGPGEARQRRTSAAPITLGDMPARLAQSLSPTARSTAGGCV